MPFGFFEIYIFFFVLKAYFLIFYYTEILQKKQSLRKLMTGSQAVKENPRQMVTRSQFAKENPPQMVTRSQAKDKGKQAAK